MNEGIETILMEVLRFLSEYQWPGNIRELQKVIECAVIISAGPNLEIDAGDMQLSKSSFAVKKPSGSESTDGLLNKVLKDTERQQIVNALKQSNWIISGAQGGDAA
jgi:formate hydrogenlyase transcriptional activator